MKTSVLQKVLRGILFALAIALIARSFAVTHRVYDEGNSDDPFAGFGMLTFQMISEAQLTVDATFSGTVRKADTIEGDGESHKVYRLFSTYDRSQPRGKKLCPT